MGLTDIIKEIFGLRRGPGDDLSWTERFQESGKRVPRDIEEELIAEFGRWNNPKEFDPGHRDDFFASHERIFEDFERVLEGLFKGHHMEGSVPWLPSDSWEKNNGQEDKPLRDKMLKDPGNQPGSLAPNSGCPEESQGSAAPFGFPFSMIEPFFGTGIHFAPPSLGGRQRAFEDRDLDKDFHSGNSSLDDLLKQDNDKPKRESLGDLFLPTPPDGSSRNFFFRSYSSSTERRPDGVVVQRQTIQDSDGNEEVIISETIGDHTETRRMRSDKEGNELKEEILHEGLLPWIPSPGEEREFPPRDFSGKQRGFVFEWKWP